MRLRHVPKYMPSSAETRKPSRHSFRLVPFPERSCRNWLPSLPRRGWGRSRIRRATPLNPPSERGEGNDAISLETAQNQIIIAKNTSQPTHARLNRMSGIFPTGGASPTGMSGFCQIVCSLDGEEDSEALSLLGCSSAMRFFSPTAQ